MFQSDTQLEDYAESDRREVNPPIEVEQQRGPLPERWIGG
jgi:hypothetical protein